VLHLGERETIVQNYLTPEEAAQHLKVEPAEIVSLVEQGKLRAARIGNSIRIPESELEKLTVTCAAVPAAIDVPASTATPEPLADNSRWVETLMGKKFRVSGSVATGAEIWPGQMRYPIKFPKPFFDALLAHLREREVAVGGSFDRPLRGSLGEFIQRKLKTKMNPAVYVRALLIDEGYAEATRRGYIRFHAKGRRG
jgi:excisionase family DNA binding protein